VKGFSLVEVLVAMALVATSVVGLAKLIAIATRVTQESRIDTVATMAAEAKMAQLRSMTWAYDAAGSGALVSDAATDVSVDPPSAGGAGLSWSPVSSLQSNVEGYVDYVDAAGAYAGRGAAPPRSAVYLRRWNIQPLPSDPAHSLVLQVTASRVSRPQSREVHLISILARTSQ
jgi:prepilin-type N-terminal cleavage/methylation domain-containing protein